MARATCSLARACLLLVAARAAAAAAFTQGNVLVLEAGDGTLAGSAAPSNASTNDHNSASAVSASFFEYSINQQTGVLTATGNVVALPAATLTSGLTLLGNVADVGNSVGTYMPYSGSLSLATDGSNLAFVGYQQPAGSLVGPSCMCYSLTSAAVNLDTPISLSLPANTVNRVIGWIDASGTVRTVNGNLNTVLGAYTINSAIWYANGPANSGFYVTGGYSFQSSGGVGGIYWVPMPSGIGGPQGTPVLVCLTPAYTATNFKMYNYLGIFNNWVYTGRTTAGTSGGVGQLPGGLPTTLQPGACTTSGTLTEVDGAGANDAATSGGWALHSFLFIVNQQGNVSMFFADGEFGLSFFTNCVGQPIVCTGYTAATGGYQTLPPITGLNIYAVGLISMFNVSIAGVNTIVVNRFDGMWLWPTNNTGAFYSTIGTCCLSSVAGQCCWGNNNQPVAVPAANWGFRGSSTVPLAPTCNTPGYACTGAGATLPAVACVAGSYCPGNYSVALLCPSGTYSTGPLFSACLGSPCAAASSGPLGSTSAAAATCTACPLGSSSLPGAGSCTPCPSGTYSATAGAPCTACATGTYSGSTGQSSSSACTACAIGSYSVAGAASCTSCTAGATTPGTGSAAATLCYCTANYFSSGFGAGLTCTACVSGATALINSAFCTCTNTYATWNATTNTCYAPPSASPTPSSSPTPTLSITPSGSPSLSSTISLSPTPSTTSTASLTASTSFSSSPTISLTSTPTSTSTGTPSPTSLPDVLLTFAFTLVPVLATPITIDAVASHIQVVTAVRTSFAGLLSVPLTSLSIANITDIATGSVRSSITQRRLGSAVAAGSLGISVTVQINNGKTPSFMSLSTIISGLQTLVPGSAASEAFFGPVVSALTQYGQSASNIAPAFTPSSLNIVNSAFSQAQLAALVPQPATSSSSSSGNGSAIGAGVGVGVIVIVLACSLWSWRSWQKHGKLPCFRDRLKERREALAQQFARNNVRGDDDEATRNPVGSETLIVRTLAKQVADQQAEVSRLNAQVAAQKAVENAQKVGRGPSMAGPKEQLRAQEAAKQAVARAAFTPTTSVK